MKKFESLEKVIEEFEDGDEFETIEDVVDALLDIGSSEGVLEYHDDHLGLKDDLSEEFLKSRISDLDEEKFESEIGSVIEQAEIILGFD